MKNQNLRIIKSTLSGLCLLSVLGIFCVVLAGCSGAGSSVEEVRGAGVPVVATDHLTAVSLTRGWMNMLYNTGVSTVGVRSAGAAPKMYVNPIQAALHDPELMKQIRTSEITDFDMEVLDDGTYHLWGYSSDGAFFEYFMERPDGTADGYRRAADGSITRYTEKYLGRNEWGTVIDSEYYQYYPDGMILFGHFYVISDDEFKLDGTLTLPDGREMEYHQTINFYPQKHTIEVELLDGTNIKFVVPFAYSYEKSSDQPVYSEGATGTFTNADGDTFDFNLTGDTDWTNWTFTKPDGATGNFNLSEGLSGNGEIRLDGELAGALHWVITGFDFTGKLDITGSRSTDVAPSKLARDFSIDRWMKNSAMLSPSPMY